MKISIVIPLYNQQEYVADAIESALEQKGDVEVIVVNDGSTDHSGDVARQYPVKYIKQKNRGLATARNVGIAFSKGDYVLPLDADDILLENCTEQVLKAIEEHRSDVIAPSFRMFGVNQGNIFLTSIPSIEEFKQANRLPYFSAFKRTLWEEVGGYNPNMKWGYEDWNFWLDVFKRHHSLCLLQEILVLYRTKEHSMIHDANAHASELWAQMRANHPDLWS